MTHCQSDPDANEIFRWHFRHYAPRAGREALFAESEAENDPQELTRFARYRFSDLLIRFTASFSTAATPSRDFCRLLGEPSRPWGNAHEEALNPEPRRVMRGDKHQKQRSINHERSSKPCRTATRSGR